MWERLWRLGLKICCKIKHFLSKLCTTLFRVPLAISRCTLRPVVTMITTQDEHFILNKKVFDVNETTVRQDFPSFLFPRRGTIRNDVRFVRDAPWTTSDKDYERHRAFHSHGTRYLHLWLRISPPVRRVRIHRSITDLHLKFDLDGLRITDVF